MQANLFKKECMTEGNPKWAASAGRLKTILKRKQDIRSDFARDYNRILHCNAYRRLKHKTQVFFTTHNDHVCTRIEHVNHVASISSVISKYFGLNTELASAIAIGHDIGHAPFGHTGEFILKKIVKEKLKTAYWHEMNSLRFVDKIELLENSIGKRNNLNLTYAVRDGIVCHCGEVDDTALSPREEYIDLQGINKVNQYAPYTWEGCVVKMADKISYLGRDIEDAVTVNLLTQKQQLDFKEMIHSNVGIKLEKINNTSLIHNLIIDLCENSSPQAGICFSDKYLDLIKSARKFNMKNIYDHQRLRAYHKYADLILNSIFDTLEKFYNNENTYNELRKYSFTYPILIKTFSKWLMKYSDVNPRNKETNIYENEILYRLADIEDYYQSIIDFISGMTDQFSIQIFNELTSF